MRHLKLVVAATAGVVSLLMSVDASKAQAPNEMVRQYGYQFCAIIGSGPDDSTRDCGYVNMDQCRATASGMGYCVENPAYIAVRENALPSPVGSPRSRRR